MATFVLVPGAWAGGWAWQDAARELRSAGHEAHTVTLTGLGDRAHLSHPEIGLSTYVQDVVNVLHYEDLHDVILVGWSYGAMPVTGAAHQVPERIARVVIVDTFLVPEDGQSAYDIAPYFREPHESQLRHGNGWQIPGLAEEVFVSSMPDAERRRWYVERQAPMPLKVWTEPVRLGNPAAERIPRTLVRCTAGGFWSEGPRAEFYARISADPSWEVVDLDGPHAASYWLPQETASVLMRIAG